MNYHFFFVTYSARKGHTQHTDMVATSTKNGPKKVDQEVVQCRA